MIIQGIFSKIYFGNFTFENVKKLILYDIF